MKKMHLDKNGGVQLPNDVKTVGYKQSPSNRFEHDQVYHSVEHDFTGTEQDFIDAGIAYRWEPTGDIYGRRIVVTD